MNKCVCHHNQMEHILGTDQCLYGHCLCTNFIKVNDQIRTFESGANRDSDQDKLDYEGFLCPKVLESYAKYMHQNRIMADGSLRDSDNWQKGIPIDQYMKSLFRHFIEVWTLHRQSKTSPLTPTGLAEQERALCAVMFNSMGMLHEILKSKENK